MPNHHEAAGTNGRSKKWVAYSSGPNRSITYDLQTLRNRSRAANSNNPWVFKALDTLVSNEVGVGVTMSSSAEDKEFREQVDKLWGFSVNELDPAGLLNFGGIQSQSVRARRVSGEVFLLRKRRVMGFGNLAVPLQVRVLEAEFVPIGYNVSLPNGNEVRDGIEFNTDDEIVAYWMYSHHPHDDCIRSSVTPIRVAASDVIHHFSQIRPGQRHGTPDAIRSLLSAYTFDLYEDAELMRKQTRAPFTGAITKDAYPEDYMFDPFTGEPLSDSFDPQSDVVPGTFLSMSPGEKLVFFDSDDNGIGLAEYSRFTLLKIAAGFNVPYEMTTGDWKNVNDRLVRAIFNEFRRVIEAAQDHLLVFQVCRGIWEWWMDAAVSSGAISAPGYADNFREYRAFQARPHGWPYTNPYQDVQAQILAKKARLTSRQNIVNGRPGPSMSEIDKQIEEDPYWDDSSEPDSLLPPDGGGDSVSSDNEV
jgi:lambda family phage portal protein